MGSAADIFVSYKADDRARLVTLVEALESEGFSVWWDAHIGGGTNWHEDIEEHLESAKCVIVAWSKSSIGHEGHFVREEARRALRRGVYLPIRLDGAEPPLGFGEIQAISLRGWHGNRSDHRFRALADAVRQRIAGKDIANVTMPYEQPGVSRRALLAGGASAIAVAAAAGWLLLKPTPTNANRIAVLPFANLSGDPAQAYFSDGIAEELRSALTRVGMQVIGRTSSDAVKDMDAKAAAAKLDVANILTGSVRRSPATIRVNAQLVSGKDGVERWAQSYDRAPGDAIKIQTDIAENVARSLSIALRQAGRAALTLGGTADTVAQDLILQSKKLNQESISFESHRRRLALADAAIARDPRYADAYVEKANALYFLAVIHASTPADMAHGLAQADAAAQKAVALAPRLGSAHAALATIAGGRLDFVNVLRHTRQSLALSPEDPDVLAYGSRNLNYLEPAQGLRVAERGIALDPLNPALYYRKCEALTYLRRYPQAIAAGRKALELAPEHSGARIYVGDALLLLGQPDKAKAEYEAIVTDNPVRLLRLALLAARTGHRAGAERMIAQLKQQHIARAEYADIYAQLGDSDRAFADLDKELQAKDSGLGYIKVNAFLDPIRSDPRYAALLRRLNFP